MNDSRLTPDDPKLTAYALGELEGADLATVEEALRRNPALRATVDDIRATAAQLEGALAAEPELESVNAAAAASSMRQPTVDEYRRPKKGALGQLLRFPQIYFVVGGVAAACFAVLAAFNGPGPTPPKTVVQHEVSPAVDPSQVPVTIVTQDAKTGKESRMIVGVNVVRDTAPAPTPDVANRKSDDAARALVTTEKPVVEDTKPAETVIAQSAPPPPPVAPTTVETPRNETGVQGGAPVEKAPTLVATAGLTPELDKVDRDTISLPAGQPAPQPVVTASEKSMAPPRSLADSTPKADETKFAAVAVAPKPAADDDMVKLSAFEVSGANPGALGAARSSFVASAKKLTPPPGARFSRTPASWTLTRDNDFLGADENSKSTFPADVGRGSYPEVQAAIKAGRLPPREAVKIEEMVNYFPYRYAPSFARAGDPFGAALEVAEAPWAPTHRLVRIGLKGRDPSTVDGLAMIAKEVRIEVIFNPTKVSSYRLIGFENPRFDPEAYKTDGPDISAGHVITALYEIVPVGAEERRTADKPAADNILYQGNVVVSTRLETASTTKALTNELLVATVYYRKPTGLVTFTTHTDFLLSDSGRAFADASADFKFAAAVAEFGMILRNSPHKGSGTIRDVIAWAGQGASSNADDPRGYRGEFIALARQAQTLLR